MCIISLSLFWIVCTCVQNIVGLTKYLTVHNCTQNIYSPLHIVGCDVTKWFWFDSRCFLIVSDECLVLYAFMVAIWIQNVDRDMIKLVRCFGFVCHCCPLIAFPMVSKTESTVYFICGRLCVWRNFRHQSSPLLSAVAWFFSSAQTCEWLNAR